MFPFNYLLKLASTYALGSCLTVSYIYFPLTINKFLYTYPAKYKPVASDGSETIIMTI